MPDPQRPASARSADTTVAYTGDRARIRRGEPHAPELCGGAAESAATAEAETAQPAETVGSIGELDLLRRILAIVPPSDAAELGAGDDCAIVRAPGGRVVVTNDLMVEGPDFRRAWSTGFDVGFKAVASNLADIAAMGAVPTGLVVGLAVPSATPVAWVVDFAEGLRSGLESMAPGCGVVGGDLSTASAVTVSITALGALDDGVREVVRSGARPGDVVAVCGPVGVSGTGLSLLYAFARTPDGEASAELAEELRARSVDVDATVMTHVAPRPRVDAGPTAARAGATAMLDVSDGLLLDAARIARASGVDLDLSSTELARDVARAASVLADVMPGVASEELESRARRLVLTGGEDHGLLATFPPDAPIPMPFRPIGVVRESAPDAGGRVLVDGEPQRPAGWDPYAWDLGWTGISGAR